MPQEIAKRGALLTDVEKATLILLRDRQPRSVAQLRAGLIQRIGQHVSADEFAKALDTLERFGFVEKLDEPHGPMN